MAGSCSIFVSSPQRLHPTERLSSALEISAAHGGAMKATSSWAMPATKAARANRTAPEADSRNVAMASRLSPSREPQDASSQLR